MLGIVIIFEDSGVLSEIPKEFGLVEAFIDVFKHSPKMVVVRQADYVLFNGSQPSDVSNISTQKPNRGTYKYFEFVVLITHIIGVIFLALDGRWTFFAQIPTFLAYFFGSLNSGFTWKTVPEIQNEMKNDKLNPKGLYHFHGFFMTSAFIFFQGEG